MKKAYIHAGAPKTGSTAIQIFCRDQEDRLAEHGYFFPKAGRNRRGAHHKIVNALRTKNFPMGESTIEKFRRGLSRTGKQKLLLSTEVLHTIFANRRQPLDRKFADMAKLSDLVLEFEFKPEYILVLRDSSAAVNSAYIQAIKSFNFDGSLDEWVDERIEKYVPILSLWTQFTDKNNFALHPIAYNKEVRSKGVIPKFLEILDVPTPTEDGTRINSGTDHVTIAAAKTLISRCQFNPAEYDGKQKSQMRAALLKAVAENGEKFENFWGLRPDQTQIIRDTYAEDQNAFSQRYWGANWEDIYEENYGKPPTAGNRDELTAKQQTAHDKIVDIAWREIEPLSKDKQAKGPLKDGFSYPTATA